MIINTMKIIPLNKGKEALVDDEDFDMLSRYHWYCDVHGYVRTSTPYKMYMHRLIMNPPKNMQIDHSDNNRLNNQRSNLRICSESQNRMNAQLRKTSKSGYKGVSWTTEKQRWKVQLRKDGKNVVSKYFQDKHEAARYYNQKAIEFFGDYAWLNTITE